MGYLPEVFCSGKLLIIGMGGGCDVITAYVVSQRLDGLSKNVAWGNTKRVTEGLSALEPDAHPHVMRVATHAPLVEGRNYYGTVGIDASVPQGAHGSPLVVVLPRGKVEESALVAIGADIATLGFDAVVGVDAGGDSLTGGIDHSGDPSTGVDQMMGRVIGYSGLPWVHVVCGLGCDGESTVEEIETALALDPPLVVSHMLGWAPLYRDMSRGLEDSRTPVIMAAAIEALEAGRSKDEGMVVRRGLNPTIPIGMLASVYVFLRK